KIKHCRKGKGLTQEQLASQIGVTLNTVQRWEAGKNNPSPLAMKNLQELLQDIMDRNQLKLL
ncbi:helix-turn-helix domain-containing protein, partial [Chloroflexota bacterium]